MSDDDFDVAKLRKTPGRANRGGGGNELLRSQLNGQVWKKRPLETLTLESGQVVQVRRPGPEFLVRTGRAAQTFSKVMSEAAKEAASDDLTDQERGIKLIESMSAEEFTAYIEFARELVCTMLVSPKLVREPNPDSDEMGPDDVEQQDFWQLFSYGMSGYYKIPVAVGSGDTAAEVQVSDLETFRDEQRVSVGSDNGAEVRNDAEQPVRDSGLDNSEGAGHSGGEAIG